eukprot:9381430-Heterocapsa_arctica.AAC.1
MASPGGPAATGLWAGRDPEEPTGLGGAVVSRGSDSDGGRRPGAVEPRSISKSGPGLRGLGVRVHGGIRCTEGSVL